jgi:phosphate transport system permease protein
MKNPFAADRRHPLEHIAEWAIRLVASFSILVIFLILLFVLREASTLVVSSTETTQEQTSTAVEEDLRPEIYNPQDGPQDQSSTAPASESTSASTESEVYNPDAEAITGPSADANVSSTESEVYNPDAEVIGSPTTSAPSAPAESDAAPEQRGLIDNLFSLDWQPVGEVPKFGIAPLLVGTAKTTFIAILFGAPLGILAAIYVAFFAPRRLREIVKPAIELLAGFPSVVIGFFCLVTVASWVQDVTGIPYRLNAIVGGVGLALAVIPIVFSIAEDSLSAVPKSLREASLALGSTEWQTAYRVMLPAAAPGVFAAVLLGIGRAFGETMIAIMATGNAPLTDWSPLMPARTVAATIGSEMGEVVWGSTHYGVLFLLGVLLFIVSFSLNAITELYVKKRLIKKFQGA